MAQPIKMKKYTDTGIQMTSRESLCFEYSSSDDEKHQNVMGDGLISIVMNDSGRKHYAG